MNTKDYKMPWVVGGHPRNSSGTSWREILSTSGEFSPAYVGEALDYNAAFIVRACNSHDDLVAALAGMMPENTGYGQSMDWEAYAAAVKVARAALAKAKG